MLPLVLVCIMEIQGHSHVSPLAGQWLRSSGIVTAVRYNGFYVQDPLGDGDPESSDALFVYTGTGPSVAVGDAVELEGRVSEYQPAADELSTTELYLPEVKLLSGGHPLPAPVLLGRGGRMPPTEIIDDDGLTLYEPSTDAIDFYESLEGMRVQLDDPLVVGPTNRFGEAYVLPDLGAGATGLNADAGITVRPGDFNPERIQIDDTLYGSAPRLNLGDRLAPVVGVLGYSYGNFELLPSVAPTLVSRSDFAAPPTRLVGDAAHLTVASFNLANLSPGEGARIQKLAAQIVGPLAAPDILGLQEIQDDSGPLDDGTTSAQRNYAALVDAIASNGGPPYEFRDIAPEDNTDGGVPGGNIRVGFLFRPDRVRFVDRGTAGPHDAVELLNEDGPRLSLSPGRIDPAHPAFVASRKPLAGEFEFRGQRVFVLVAHLSSKAGSSPLFGALQPPVDARAARRLDQARVLDDFVGSLLALDPDARVVLLGDFNEFQFRPPLLLLENHLTNLTHALPELERRSYVFEGNAQALDHILVSASLSPDASFEALHLNTPFASAASDHDPILARLRIDPATRTLLVEFEASPGVAGIELRWTLDAGAPALRFVLLRRTGAEGRFKPIPGPIESAGASRFRFLDEEPRPGRSYRYRLLADDGSRSWLLFETAELVLPIDGIALESVHPNPSEQGCFIAYRLPRRSAVTLDIYDARGRRVKRLLAATRSAGRHRLWWNGRDGGGAPVGAGVYYVQLRCEGRVEQRKITVLE